MKLFLVTLCVALSSAARLDNTYLPPGNARTAGGSGNFLAAPRGGPGFGAAGSGFGGGAHGGLGGGSGFGGKTGGFGPSSGFGGPGTGFGAGAGSGFGGAAHGGLGGGSGFGGKTGGFGPSSGFGGPGAGFGGGAGSGFGGKGAGFGGSAGFGAGSGFANRPFPAAPAGPAPVYGAPGAQGQYRSGAGHSGPQIPIVRYNNENFGDGSYRYEYATGNGIQAQEAGQLKNAGSQQEANDVHGSFAYTGDDGNQYAVSYVADENGFQPQGAHLPTPPPIPEAILKSLEQNARYPQSGGEDGQYRGDAGQYSGAGGQFGGAGGAPGAGGAGQYHSGAGQFNRGGPGAFGNVAASRQYLAPRKPSFSPSTGYNY